MLHIFRQHIYIVIFFLCHSLWLSAQNTDVSADAESPKYAALSSDVIDSLLTIFPDSFTNPRANTLDGGTHLQSFFQRVHDGQAPRVMMIGDSHVFGKVFPNTLAGLLSEAWPGMEFSSLSKNGVQLPYFLDPARYGEIERFHPDLLIVSVGTNEAHSPFDEERYESIMSKFTSLVDSISPSTVLLFTTTPGSHKSQYGAKKIRVKGKRGRTRTRTQRYLIARKPNDVNDTVSNCQASFCQSNKHAMWNLYEIAGGKEWACQNWVSTTLMRGDGVHFTRDGYRLQALLLFKAIMQEYNKQ